MHVNRGARLVIDFDRSKSPHAAALAMDLALLEPGNEGGPASDASGALNVDREFTLGDARDRSVSTPERVTIQTTGSG
jgi:hypothetical protein